MEPRLLGRGKGASKPATVAYGELQWSRAC